MLRKLLYHILTTFFNREKLMFLLADKQERTLLGFKHGGYLHDIGWSNTIKTDNIADKHNQPLPWVTYPYISFIENRLTKQLNIFEYGSGNSTLYYSQRVGRVDSVENDLFWYQKIKDTMPANVNLYQCDLDEDGAYCRQIQKINQTYDMVIVDGRDRVNCCLQSFSSLNPGGVLVLDDAERPEYDEAITFLTHRGFKRLDFWGLAPAVNYLKCTTIFYRPLNCLDI